MALKFIPRGKSAPKEVGDRQRLTSLINSMADAVIAVDAQANVELYNSAALNILNINNIELNTPLVNILKPIDKNEQQVDLTAMIKASHIPISSRDLRLVYSDNSKINLYLSIAPVHLSYGKTGPNGYVLLLRDITREKSLEEERDEFISVISHELRTPIAIAEGNISNASLLAERTDIDPSIKQALTEAHNQVLFLADMINDLSTLSRAERGKLDLRVEQVDVNQLVTELAHNYLPEAQKKKLGLSFELDANVRPINTSNLYAKEILQNFITNALKYTHQGVVKVSVKSDANGAAISVQDSGIGISKADQMKVFDKFFRSEDYRTRQANGTGLGLYVTAKLAKLINAKISLSSELNKGSTFTVLLTDLPLTAEAEALPLRA